MKKILFAAFAIVSLFLTACREEKDLLPEETDQIMVRFQNSLSSDLEGVRMEFDDTNVTELGSIAVGQKTAYFDFDYFLVGDGFPMGVLNGKKDGLDFSAWSGLWCGTGVEFKQLDPGFYTIEIVQLGQEVPGFYQIRFLE